MGSLNRRATKGASWAGRAAVGIEGGVASEEYLWLNGRRVSSLEFLVAEVRNLWEAPREEVDGRARAGGQMKYQSRSFESSQPEPETEPSISLLSSQIYYPVWEGLVRLSWSFIGPLPWVEAWRREGGRSGCGRPRREFKFTSVQSNQCPRPCVEEIGGAMDWMRERMDGERERGRGRKR